MDQYLTEPSRNAPLIHFRVDGSMRIKGRSIHENVAEFYQPAFEWVDEYLKDPADVTCIEIELEYFNSASAKYIIKLLQKFKEVIFSDKKYVINWYYEEGDEDILEKGEYFSSVLSVPFKFTETT